MRPVFSPLEKIVDVLRCAQLYLIIWTKLSLVVMANVVVQTFSPPRMPRRLRCYRKLTKIMYFLADVHLVIAVPRNGNSSGKYIPASLS